MRRSPLLVSFVVVAAASACSGKPHPPPCDAVKQPWTPASIATPYASNAAAPSASTSASPVSAAPKTPYSLEQMLNVKRAFSPVALNDRDFLYLYDESGTAQVWLHRGVIGAEAKAPIDKPLTKLADRVAAVRASNDGKKAVFLVDHGGDENFRVELLDVEGTNDGATLSIGGGKVRCSLPSFDDKGARIAFTANARNGKDMDLHLAVVPKGGGVATGEAMKPLVELSGSWTVSDFRGDKVLLEEERSSFDQDLWIIDAKSKQKKLLTKHTGEERWFDAHFSRDGKVVFALSDAGKEFVGVTAIDVASGKKTSIVAVDHDVDRLAVPRWTTPRAKTTTKGGVNGLDEVTTPEDALVYATNFGGAHHLTLANLDGERKVTSERPLHFFDALTLPVVDAIDVAGDGRTVVAAVEDSTHPPQIYGSKSDAALTPKGDVVLDPATLVPARTETFATFEQKSIPYFIYLKPSEKKQPVVVVVHGGPEAQAQPGFSALIQYLALSGYAVVMPNVRGSTGYGKAFAHLDDKEKRLDAVKDLSELGKALAARPDVDGAHIALFGGSYGGFMVLAGLAFYPKRWAAGVDIVGIANFKTFLEQTAPYRRALREAEYGSLEKDGKLLDEISPIHKVDQIVAPLMVIHGTNDPRVPVGEAKQIAEALQKKGVPVELMIFDDEGHGLAKLKNRLIAYPAAVKFLDAHLR